jgi:hypothetical protein
VRSWSEAGAGRGLFGACLIWPSQSIRTWEIGHVGLLRKSWGKHWRAASLLHILLRMEGMCAISELGGAEAEGVDTWRWVSCGMGIIKSHCSTGIDSSTPLTT